MRKSLKSQVQRLSALPIVGLTAVAICVSVVLTQNRVSIEAERSLASMSLLVTSVIRERQSSLDSQTKLFTEMPALVSALSPLDGANLTKRAQLFAKDSHVDAVLIAGSDGRLLARGGLDIGTPGRPLRELIRKSAGGTPSIRTVFQGDRLFWASAIPINKGERQVGTAVSLSLFGNELAGKLGADSSADVAFVSGGKLVGSSIKGAVLPPLQTDKLQRATLGGTKYFFLSRPIPGAIKASEGSLVCLKKFSDLAAPFRALSSTFIFLISGALIATLLLARTFAESLSEPLGELVTKATLLRDGKWPEPTSVQRSDELGLLQSVFNDMASQLKASQEKVLAMVDTDPLTGLDNHRCFKERLDQEVFRATMSNKSLVLVLMDLDKFQTYNVEHGHVAGDEALKLIASLLSDVAPDVAFLSRYGGEEFAMLLPLSTPEDAERMLDHLRTGVEKSFDGQLTFSAGIADVGPSVNTGAGLFLSAEFAMSRAKKFGRSQVCRFDVMSAGIDSEDPLQLKLFLQDTTFSTIQALAGAVDAKDPYTQGHSLRVAQLASDLARYLGHPKDFVELVHKTATLHDVGKIGVPDSVLSKTSRLDSDEQSIMETHPVLGELIVKRAPQLRDMLPGVRHHHERWDGNGYPDQLKGVRIPLLARIIAVADTYDAMTSDRPYRRALPHDIALGEIMRKSGVQFDPDLATAFVRMMQMNGSQLRAA